MVEGSSPSQPIKLKLEWFSIWIKKEICKKLLSDNKVLKQFCNKNTNEPEQIKKNKI